MRSIDLRDYIPTALLFGIVCEGVQNGQLMFSFYCRECGGCTLTADDATNPKSLVRCKACERPLGNLDNIKWWAEEAASNAGLMERASRAATWTTEDGRVKPHED